MCNKTIPKSILRTHPGKPTGQYTSHHTTPNGYTKTCGTPFFTEKQSIIVNFHHQHNKASRMPATLHLRPSQRERSPNTDWIPFSGFLDHFTCCTAPKQGIDSLIVVDEDDDVVDHALEPPQAAVSSSTPQYYMAAAPRSPPSRQQVDPWDPTQACFCGTTPSLVGSTTTTASIQSDPDEQAHFGFGSEIRSNATTQVISHRRGNNNKKLLNASLENAKLRMKRRKKQSQALEEERAYQYLMRRPSADDAS